MSLLALTRQVGSSVTRILSQCLRVPPLVASIPENVSYPIIQHTSFSSLPVRTSFVGSLLQVICGHNFVARRNKINFGYMHRTGKYVKVRRKRKNPMEGRPQLRGVVLKTLIKKPKKPNSANRKCVRIRLSTGKEVIAYVPGEGHNLQEHNTVLVQGGRLQDTPGVKVVCIRGKFDLPHVKKK